MSEALFAVNERLFMGEDMRWYRKTGGAVEAVVPVKPSRARALVGREELEKARPKLVRVDKRRKLPPGLLKWVYQEVLAKVDEEALVVFGAKDGKFGVVVPEQKVSYGGCEYTDEEAGRMMATAGYWWTGTVHKHPGSGIDMSGTDQQCWEEIGVGLHAIVDHKGENAQWYAGAEGHVWRLNTVKLRKKTQPPEFYGLSGSKPLGELLKRPAPVIYDSKCIDVGGYVDRSGEAWPSGWSNDPEWRMWLNRDAGAATQPAQKAQEAKTIVQVVPAMIPLGHGLLVMNGRREVFWADDRAWSEAQCAAGGYTIVGKGA